jgi:hypothetical protein
MRSLLLMEFLLVMLTLIYQEAFLQVLVASPVASSDTRQARPSICLKKFFPGTSKKAGGLAASQISHDI